MDLRRPPGSTGPGEPGPASSGSPEWWNERGRGEYDPDTGIWEWYELDDSEQRKVAGQETPPITWAEILSHWVELECDLQSVYGIDIDDRWMLRRKSWRWLETRILGLLDIDSRLSRALMRVEKTEPSEQLSDQPLQAA